MALSNLFSPNSYDLFCNSITVTEGIPVGNSEFQTYANELSIPENSTVSDIFPITISPSDENARLKYEFNGTLRYRINAGELVTINLVRLDTEPPTVVRSWELGGSGGLIVEQSIPISLSHIDTFFTGSPVTYSLQVVNNAGLPGQYLIFNFLNRTQSQVSVVEV